MTANLTVKQTNALLTKARKESIQIMETRSKMGKTEIRLSIGANPKTQSAAWFEFDEVAGLWVVLK